MKNYRLCSRSQLAEFRAEGLLYEHTKSGCFVYHVATPDPEALFGFCFRTPPPDSSGVTHILEHTVLCGSRRFPIKEPFVGILQSSMNTFLNAMTFPDKTMYPAASPVERDLFNIIDVYGDAVFFPLLREEMFRQEGHRLRFGSDGRLELSGIVYNEMVGATATHNDVANEWLQRGLFPDTPYSFNSGGEPDDIPSLTYTDFVAYHRRYYHPSNALVFLYGAIPTEDWLAFLDERFLRHFERRTPEQPVALQPHWDAPRALQRSYPSLESSGASDRAQSSVTLGWLLTECTDPRRLILFEALNELLIGHSGAPLYRAITQSPLGEDLSASSGFESDLRQLVFGIGMRGTEPTHRDEIEALVMGELRRLRDNGFAPSAVKGTLRKLEFRSREIRALQGLRLLRRTMRGWLNGAAPEQTLEFAPHFAWLEQELERNPRLFQESIERYLIDNPHRLTLTVSPEVNDADSRGGTAQRRRIWIAECEQALTDSERQTIKLAEEELRAMQLAPEDGSAAGAVPTLALTDLPPRVPTIPVRRKRLGQIDLLCTELFCNDIVYIEVAFDIAKLPAEHSRWLALFSECLSEIDLTDMPYDELAYMLALHVGGIECSLEVASRLGDGRLRPLLVVRLKALRGHLEQAMSLFIAILTRSDFRNSQRVSDIHTELRNHIRAGVLPSGTAIAAMRASGYFDSASRIEEQWYGASQLLLLCGYDPSRDRAAIGALLGQICAEIVRNDDITIALGCAAKDMAAARRQVERLAAVLGPAATLPAETTTSAAALPAVHTGDYRMAQYVRTATTVNYVAMVMKASAYHSEDWAAELVLAHILSTGLLWNRIRMSGGAYGAVAQLRRLEPIFLLGSYRDPNIAETIQAFHDCLREFANVQLTSASLAQALIGVAGKEHRPMSPGMRVNTLLRRHLFGVADTVRQAKYEQIIGLNAEILQRAAIGMKTRLDEATLCVIGGDDALRKVSAAYPQLAAAPLDLAL